MSKLYIKALLDSTRTELAEVFPHLTDADFDWAPAPGMRTIQGQFVEIIGTEIALQQVAKNHPRRSSAEVDAELFELKTVGAMIEKLTQVRRETLEFLANASENQLAAPVTISQGFKQYLELEEIPASELIRHIGRHEAYHTGQLMSYLWAKGNNPYDWD